MIFIASHRGFGLDRRPILARTLGLEPKPMVLETTMLPITPGPYMVRPTGIEPARLNANGFSYHTMLP